MKRTQLRLESLECRRLLAVTPEFILDIRPGEQGAAIQEITPMGDRFYFRADNGTHGSELWVSDGTTNGTQMLKDIHTGGKDSHSRPGWFKPFGDHLYFAATDAVHGTELWRTDGTAAGTQLVKDIDPGSGDGAPAELHVFNNELYFSASGGGDNHELWKSDGTAAGTQLVKEIRPGVDSSNPGDFSGFFEFGQHLYFNAEDETHGVELWRTDGTAAGTQLVLDADPEDNGYPFNFFEFQGDLYFEAERYSNQLNDWHSYLFRVDAGTGQAAQALDMPIAFNHGPLVVGDYIYVSALREDVGFELFRTDGTAAGTQLVRDVFEGPKDANPRNLTQVGDRVYFMAGDQRDPVTQKLLPTLWSTDGTPLGTRQLSTNLVDASKQPVVWGNDLYFTAFTDQHGWELHRTDGTVAGTQMVHDSNPGDADSFARPLQVFDGQLLYMATSVGNGYEIWSWDQAEAVMTDVGFGGGDFTAEPSLFRFEPIGNDLIFLAQNPFEGEELHAIRGSAAVAKPGDIDGDGTVAFADFLILSSNFNRDDAQRADGDLNGDGRVDFADFLVLSANFGK